MILCVDFGSTWTKAGLVDVETGTLVATASHPTTTSGDLLEALDALRADLAARVGEPASWEVRACSSAGGGLRVAVVGNEELVTAEAGRQVAASSGGRVVHVAAGTLDHAAVARLREARADLVLLVGGTDGGNTRVLLANAGTLARARLRVPVVVAGNADCRAEAERLLARAGTPVAVAANVLPDIGVVRPEPARAAIREAFVEHVIGGKRLSRRAEFGRIVRGATPDVVLRGVEVFAQVVGTTGRPGGRGVVVVDVGGATTDVHSVVPPDPEDTGPRREVVPQAPVSRTVEADLGLRWNATGIVDAARDAALLDPGEASRLREAAALRVADPGLVPSTPTDHAADERLAALAVTLALRRHAGRSRLVTGPAGPVVEHTGKDLREIGVLVGSGGVLRHGGRAAAGRVLAAGLAGRDTGGWLLPERPRLCVDTAYVLMAAGLLIDDHPDAAATLVETLLSRRGRTSERGRR